MTETRPKLLRFGEFTADLDTQELWRAGVPVRLPNQSFVVLAALIEKPGSLVTREELQSRVWPDNRVVEFEQGLNAVVNRLRESLGDRADAPDWIETLPRRGYRFIGRLESPPDVPLEAPKVSMPARGFAWRATVLGIPLLATALIAYWRLQRPAPPLSIIEPLTTLVGQERMPAFSVAGDRLVFAWDGNSRGAPGFDLYVKTMGKESVTALTHAPALSVSGTWSPDGSQVAFARMDARNGGVFTIPAIGGAERKLVDASFAQESLMQPSWSPDGQTLAYSAIDTTGSQTVRVLNLKTLDTRPLANAPACWHAGAPAFSPDGRQLALVCMTSIAVYGVYLVDTSGGTPRLLAKLQGMPQGLAWARERLLVANDGGDGSGVWQLETNGTLHRPAIIEESLGPGVSATREGIAWSRARRVIDIWRLQRMAEGTRTDRWIYSTREQLTPQYSPDDARIAFQSNRSGNPEIWIADADGANPVRITKFDGPMTGAPAWCADGRRVAFDSRASGVSAVYVVDTLEREARRVETPQPNLALPVWSADCQWLLASDGRAVLYRVPASGGEAQRFTRQRSYQAAVVGDQVIFNVADPADVELWTRPMAGGQEMPLRGMPHLGYADSWTASRDAIYFTDTSSQPVKVRRYDLATGVITEFATLPNVPTPLGGLGLAVTGDGHSLLYTHTEDSQSDLVFATAQK